MGAHTAKSERPLYTREAAEAAGALPEPLLTQDGRELYPLTAVAKRLGFSRSNVQKRVRLGQIQGRRVGREWLVDLADAQRYKAAAKRLGQHGGPGGAHFYNPNKP